MASLYTKFLDFIGIEESDEQEDDRRDDGYYRDDAPERAAGGAFGAGRAQTAPNRRNERVSNTSGANLPISGGMKMIVYHPVSYEDTQSIIDNLKNRKPVIVNMEELEIDCAQRILDFMAGAIYALNGTIYKISRGIFVVAPTNYDIIGNDESAEYVDVI